MAHKVTFSLALASVYQLSNGLTTCPGFPGFCSESFPGQTCNVVCDFGRNNVPLCQVSFSLIMNYIGGSFKLIRKVDIVNDLQYVF